MVASLLLVAVTGNLATLARPLWLDEYHTLWLATDPDPRHALWACAHGAEHNPPLLAFGYRAWAAVAGGLDPVRMRIPAVLSVALAAMFVQRLVSRVTGGPGSVLAAASLLAHPLVIEQGFNARFYGPWLAAAALFLLALDRSCQRSDGWSAGLLAISSALVCTLQYLGLLYVIAAAGAALWAQGRSAAPKLAPVLGGLAIGAATAAWFVPGQQAVLTTSWVPPPDLEQLVRFFGALSTGLPVLLAAVAYLHLGGWQGVGAAVVAHPWRRFAPAFALGAVPVVHVVISAAGLHTTVPRYAMPALIGPACMVGLLLASTRSARFVRASGLATLLVVVALLLHRASVTRESGDFLDNLRVEAQSVETPVLVFQSLHLLLPICADDPRLRERCFVLDVGSDRLDRLATFERDIARALERAYGYPRTISGAEVAAQGAGWVGNEASVARAMPDNDVVSSGRYVGRILPAEPQAR